ncbi:MAG: hypothetical protein J1G01_02010 [Clostridiales bacterium]|nr:hypothetical protein [Clostridiales bacterium]
MSTFYLRINTPTREVYSGEVEYLSVNTPTGRAGFMRGALPRIAVVSEGRIEIKSTAVDDKLRCGDGIMQLTSNGVNLLLPYCRHESDETDDDIHLSETGKKPTDERNYRYAKARIASSILKMKDKSKGDD